MTGAEWAGRKDFRVPESTCPNCGKKLDAAAAATGDDPPEPADFTMCIGCRAFLRFDDDVRPRLLTPGDLVALAEVLLRPDR